MTSHVWAIDPAWTSLITRSADARSKHNNNKPSGDLLYNASLPLICSPILSPFILIPLLAFEPPGFLPLQHRNPLHQHGKHTPHYFSCTYEASSLPLVFSLLHHQESIWIRGGLQGTQTKAQNGPTSLPKTDLELRGLSHVGFGPQNY